MELRLRLIGLAIYKLGPLGLSLIFFLYHPTNTFRCETNAIVNVSITKVQNMQYIFAKRLALRTTGRRSNQGAPAKKIVFCDCILLNPIDLDNHRTHTTNALFKYFGSKRIHRASERLISEGLWQNLGMHN